MRSLERNLQSWQFHKSGPISLDDSQLIQRLWVLFYDMGLNDREMIRFVVKEGYPITFRV